MLRLFVRLALFDEDQAAGMLTWPHSGFHVHTAVWVPEDDRAFATRHARYCARNPVALERLQYDRAAKAVTYRSDKSEGPTAGTETVDPLACLARVLVHLPDTGHATTRYDGYYANRPRGMRGKAEPAAIVPALRLAPTEASRRWSALVQQIFEVDPLACPACHGTMRVVAFITQASVIDRILAHLRTRTSRVAHPGARSPPSTRPRHPDAARGRSAGTFGVRGGPIGASCQLPPAPGPPPGRRLRRPARRAGALAVTPTPARRCSRGGRPRRILDRPRLNFLSGAKSRAVWSEDRRRGFTAALGGRGCTPRLQRKLHLLGGHLVPGLVEIHG